MAESIRSYRQSGEDKARLPPLSRLYIFVIIGAIVFLLGYAQILPLVGAY